MRGRSVHEQMVHRGVSENLWVFNTFGINVGAPPLLDYKTRLEFIRRYAEDSGLGRRGLAEMAIRLSRGMATDS